MAKVKKPVLGSEYWMVGGDVFDTERNAVASSRRRQGHPHELRVNRVRCISVEPSQRFEILDEGYIPEPVLRRGEVLVVCDDRGKVHVVGSG